MRMSQRKSPLSYIPGLKDNAVLKLIIFSGVAYMLLAISWAINMMVLQGEWDIFNKYFVPNVALGDVHNFGSSWWTILTYGWFQFPNTFMELLSNMVWLYLFGSLVQMLVGGKHIVPIYVYALTMGGVVYMLAQFIPGKLGMPAFVNSGGSIYAAYLGPKAGIVAMAVASITLAPKYKLYITPTLSIPLMGVAGVFIALALIFSGTNFPSLLMVVAGGIVGFGYIKLIQAGYRPAQWAIDLINKIESVVTPKNSTETRDRVGIRIKNKVYAPINKVSQSTIDEILDKINQKGYNALSKEEKEMLLRAGKE